MSPAAWIAAFVRSSQTGILARFAQMISIGDDGGWSPSRLRVADHSVRRQLYMSARWPSSANTAWGVIGTEWD
ncbi:hypothetical protein C8Q76DRAFT_713097 [Earliella scabrosa]|nr:hypothetical protein C8Q76DRAFT_713097 [Earliella scabrosa]